MQVQFKKHGFGLLQEDTATLVPLPYVDQIIHKQGEKQCWAQKHTCMRLQTLQLHRTVLTFTLAHPRNSQLDRLHSGAVMSQGLIKVLATIHDHSHFRRGQDPWTPSYLVIAVRSAQKIAINPAPEDL